MTRPPATFQPAPGPGAHRAEQLRAQFPRFVYERFSLDRSADALRVKFHFRIEPGIEFAPETTFLGADWQRVDSLAAGTLENYLFHLGLIETLSYWKATCSPEIRVEAGALEPEQVAWFLDLLRHGMGEFFYVNQIDPRAPGFVKVVTGEKEKQILRFAQDDKQAGARDDREKIRAATVRERAIPASGPLAHARGSEGDGRDLVLTSGGKDSVVTLELLQETGRAFDCLLLNPTEAALAVARQAGCSSPIIVRRTIDPRLLELNAAGYLNGHTPFSALLAVLGVTAAALFGYSRVIVSNERSAEEAGVEYLGEPINHQYSKTYRFETAFREYCRKYLAPSRCCHPEEPFACHSERSEESAFESAQGKLRGEGSAFLENAPDDSEGIDYFSLLRPLYELQIARLFAQHSEYFPLFRSCNRGIASNSWCGRCSKCLFVYTALYPFVEREQMLAIFNTPSGQDLFAWDGAAEILRALLGLDAHKPFECVGTHEETLAALYLCVEKKMKKQGLPLPAALRTIEDMILSSRPDFPDLTRRVLTSWTDQHHLPPELAPLLRQRISSF